MNILWHYYNNDNKTIWYFFPVSHTTDDLIFEWDPAVSFTLSLFLVSWLWLVSHYMFTFTFSRLIIICFDSEEAFDVRWRSSLHFLQSPGTCPGSLFKIAQLMSGATQKICLQPHTGHGSYSIQRPRAKVMVSLSLSWWEQWWLSPNFDVLLKSWTLSRVINIFPRRDQD